MSKSVRILIGAILVMLVVSSGSAGAVLVGRRNAAIADPNRQERITVQGQGRSSGVPDIMQLSLTIDPIRPSIQSALDASNTAASKVMNALRRHGVAQKDIQTTGLSIDRAYSYPKAGGPAKFRGYRVSNSIQANLRNLKRAGSTIEAAATSGGNSVRINGISFAIEDSAALMKGARAVAMRDARAKAEQYAKMSGRRLGKAEIISEQLQPTYAQPYGYALGSAAVAGPTPPQYVPISTGQQQVTVLLTVVYAFA